MLFMQIGIVFYRWSGPSLIQAEVNDISSQDAENSITETPDVLKNTLYKY